MSPKSKIDLSDKFLRALKPPAEGRAEYPDAKRPGLSLRHSKTGRATWVFEKRVKNGPKRKHSLGTYPAVGLSVARSMALEIAAEAERGIDRVALAEQAKKAREAEKASATTTGEAIERYFQLHLRHLRTGDERRRQLETILAPHFSDDLRKLRRADLVAVIDAKAAEGRLVRANRLRAAMSAFTGWLTKRGMLETNIGADLPEAVKERDRDVVLSVGEVRSIFDAAEQLGPLWGPLVRLLVLTAQRRGDIGELLWSEVKGDRLEVGGERTKNGQPHIVHLSAPALAEIDRLPREGSLVFTTTGTTPVSGFSKMKLRLDGLLGEDFPSWRLHDLRTAFATAMGELGEGEGVIDRVLNHAAAATRASTVARTYNRAALLKQRARVLDRWADLVTGEAGKVVELRDAR